MILQHGVDQPDLSQFKTRHVTSKPASSQGGRQQAPPAPATALVDRLVRRDDGQAQPG